MDVILANIIFGIIFGLIGFALTSFFGFNIATLFSNLGAIVILGPLLILMVYTAVNPEAAIEKLPQALEIVFSSIPGVIIGDISGAFVGLIIGSK